MQEIQTFLSREHYPVLVAAILLAVTIYSSLNLVTTPRLWVDEALTIEMSRNVATQGVLDIQTAPGAFSGTPQYLQSTGYTVTYPLALVFSVFGVGAVQARVYMLVWLLLALLVTYLVIRPLFGTFSALGSILLLSSFATFYADGRTVTGEVPGFLFLMAGMYFFLVRPTPLVAGLLWGLAIVTKPSIYLLLIPAVTLAVFFQKHKGWAEKVRTLLQTGLGALAPVAVWFLVSMPDMWSGSSWTNLAAFYRNPYGAGDSPSLLQNLTAVIHSTTILYFGGWLTLIAIARRYLQDKRHLFFYTLAMLYSAIAFIYYLRSPGWLRYIFAGELLILVLLPHTLGVLTDTHRRFWPKRLWGKEVVLALAFLVVVQIVQLSFFSDMFTSARAVQVADYINTHEPHASVVTFGALEVSSLLVTDERYNSLVLLGIPALDTNPLSGGIFPDIVVGAFDNPHIVESHKFLEQRYQLQVSNDGMLVYTLTAR